MIPGKINECRLSECGACTETRGMFNTKAKQASRLQLPVFSFTFESCALNAGVLKADQTVKRNPQELLEQLRRCDSVPSIRWKFHLRCCKVRVSLRGFIFLEGFIFFF